MKLTDEQRAALTEEELAGIEEEDEQEEEVEAQAEPEADAAAEPEQEEPAKVEAKAEQPANEQAAEPEVEAPKPDRQPRPMFTSDADVADIDRQLAAIKEGKAELARQFDEGEITYAAMMAKQSDLTDNEYALRETKLKANLAQEVAQTQQTATWEDACNDFLSAHPECSTSPLRFNSFDQAVRMITGDQANANLGANQLLEKAYSMWSTELGIAPTQAPASKPEAKRPKQNVVPTLGAVPAATVSDTDDGEFGYLDRLKGVAYEEALAKLPAAKRDAYLMS